MWIAAGLSVSLLVNIPFFGNVDLHKLFHHTNRVAPTAADSLPPPWKPANRLAIENQFVFSELPTLSSEETALKLSADPREMQVSVLADSGTIVTTSDVGDVPLGDFSQPLSAYSQSLSEANFRRAWQAHSLERINTLGDNVNPNASASTGGMSFHLPIPIPDAVTKVIGPGGPAINVRGSEQIQISGTSNWTNQQVGQLGQKRSLFPSLDMQQNLDVQLEGQLSDRIRVNLLQNSATQIPLSNRIAINYHGDEDALFQEIDLGNTNLSLPGTQYVSYSGKNEGLFGAKATSRFGPLDLTILASKQEGSSERASYGGGASKQTQTIRDLEYVRGVYFFLFDPSVPSSQGTIGWNIPESSIRVYRDDANSSNDVNVVRGVALVDPNAQVAPGVTQAQAEIGAVPGVDSTSFAGPGPGGIDRGPGAVRGEFDQLNPGADKDYEVLSNVYGTNFKVIRLTQALTGEQRLAVTYQRQAVNASGVPVGPLENVGGTSVSTIAKVLDTDRDSSLVMQLVRVPPDLIGPSNTTPQVFDSTKVLNGARELELKNFYQLAGQKIDPASLQISIRRGQDIPPKTSIPLQTPTSGGSVPYIQILGLDNLDETTGTPVRGHDGKIDGTVISSTIRSFVDYDNGTLFLPDPRPFAPRLSGPGARFFDQAVNGVLNRDARLQGDPGQNAQADTSANRLAYDKYVLQGDTDAQYYIDVQFNAARAAGQISLGRGNILDGSEVVTINGQALQRGRDYDIDYDLGQVTLKRQLGPADQLNIDYSYAPLFQQAGRTLLGSAFTVTGNEKSFGGAFLYESHGAQDLRPRIGEEPSRSLIGDLNTDWTFHPDWMTRMVDMLPGIRTTAPSDFRVTAEAGASFPNPNTKNEIYIDDMEGVRDAVSLSMDQSHWRWSSVPKLVNGTLLSNPGSGFLNAETHWYSPYAVVKERDLKPSLTDAEGAQNNHQVLAVSIPRKPSADTTSSVLWSGLMYSLDAAGLDLSRSQFIELWVNDFRDSRVRTNHLKLHIDLGRVSEDMMRAPNQPPNGVLDSEDKIPRDGQLTVVGSNNEDTGYDGLLDDDEKAAIAAGKLTFSYPVNGVAQADLTTASDADPDGDDFQNVDDTNYKEEMDARRYRFTNGTEGDKNLVPVPETEDLNNNGNVDTDEAYFEYTVDLGLEGAASPYLGTDVLHDFGGIPEDNGWRRYRIPITDSLRVQFGSPDLTSARHLRMWLEGVQPDLPDVTPTGVKSPIERPLVMLGSLDIVGSRWRVDDQDSTITLNTVNTQDNADVYRAPFDPGTTLNGSQTLQRREQSISMEFRKLEPAEQVEAFRTFSLDEDYSRYGKLDWYITGFGIHDSLDAITNEGLDYFVRFASDEQGLNYYEYRAPVPLSPAANGLAWKEVTVALTEFSGIKLHPGYNVTRGDTVALAPGSPDSIIIHGQPSFTRLRRVSFGLVNQGGHVDTGQLWFDELRGTDVAKDAGHAQRVQVSGHMANLLQYQFGYDGRDENFLSVGQTRGSGTATDNYSFSGNLDLHRFFEATGIVLPVSFNFSQSTQRPRFSAGDDVVRGGADLIRSESFSDSRAWNVSYSRSWSDRAFPLLRYTLGGVTANFSSANAHTRNPSGNDRSSTTSGGVNYLIAPRSLLQIPMPFLKARLFPLPERMYANWRVDVRRENASDRLTDSLGVDHLVDRNPIGGRSGAINMGADTRPFDFFHHHIEALRNLQLGYDVFSLNVGRVTTWSQTNDATFTPRFLPWLKPQLSWSSHYNQNNGPELSPDLSVRSISNGQQASVRWELPFGSLANGATSPLPTPAPRDTGHAAPRAPAGPALWRRLASKLGNVTAEVQVTKGSGYSRLLGLPDFFYLFGLTGNPKLVDPVTGRGRMIEAVGDQSTLSTDWRAAGHTVVTLPLNMSLQTGAEFQSHDATSNGAERAEDNLRFPDVTFDFGNFPSWIKLDKLVHNPRLRSALDEQTTTDYNNGRSEKSGVSKLLEFRPLLDISGELPNGMQIELNTEHRHSDRELFQLGSSLQQDINTDVDLSLNRSYSAGQKITFLGHESTVHSSITLGITGRYERQTGRILDNGVARNPVNHDRLSVDANGSYGFSTNVNGQASLGFSQDRDKLRAIVNRSIRIQLSTRFTL